MLLTHIKRYVEAFVDLIYPRSCPGCNNSMLHQEKMLCITCQLDLPIYPFFHSQNNEVQSVFAGRLPLETANCLLYFTKNGIAQGLLHALKYQDREDIGMYLGELLGAELLRSGYRADVLLPVPLHPDKQKARGYNQCHSIALGVQRALGGGMIAYDAIERTTANRSQTKLSRIKRWDNVSGIFRLVNAEALANKRVLILDDTLTTGATLESCGITALEAGNVRLSIATLAYAK